MRIFTLSANTIRPAAKATVLAGCILALAAVGPGALCDTMRLDVDGEVEGASLTIVVSGNWSAASVDRRLVNKIRHTTENEKCNSMLLSAFFTPDHLEIRLPNIRPSDGCPNRLVVFGHNLIPQKMDAALLARTWTDREDDSVTVKTSSVRDHTKNHRNLKLWIASCRDRLGEPCASSVSSANEVVNEVMRDSSDDMTHAGGVYRDNYAGIWLTVKARDSYDPDKLLGKLSYTESCSAFKKQIDDAVKSGDVKLDEIWDSDPNTLNVYYLDRSAPEGAERSIKGPHGRVYIESGETRAQYCGNENLVMISVGTPRETLAHEFGHFLGLPDVPAPPNNLMRKGARAKCTLTLDQMETVTALKGPGSFCNSDMPIDLSGEICAMPVTDERCSGEGRNLVVNYALCLHCSNNADTLIDIGRIGDTESHLSKLATGHLRIEDRLRLREVELPVYEELAERITGSRSYVLNRIVGIQADQLRERSVKLLGGLLGSPRVSGYDLKSLACELREIARGEAAGKKLRKSACAQIHSAASDRVFEKMTGSEALTGVIADPGFVGKPSGRDPCYTTTGPTPPPLDSFEECEPLVDYATARR